MVCRNGSWECEAVERREWKRGGFLRMKTERDFGGLEWNCFGTSRDVYGTL